MIDFRLASATQIQAELGERLRLQRMSRSWTQRDLALRAGVALNAVRNLEAGGNVTVASLVKVLQVLSLVVELEDAFQPKATLSIADLERLETPQRQRVRPGKT
ncbi:helix-turn-helix domain-containing protein [Roseateles sp.]|uniref:helix-turn-helix domain-containing protein n=1 Tax=Roseateles sp. TaxID=1971397 RepID=UPI002F40A5AD